MLRRSHTAERSGLPIPFSDRLRRLSPRGTICNPAVVDDLVTSGAELKREESILNDTRWNRRLTQREESVRNDTRWTVVKVLVTRRSWVQIPPPPPSQQQAEAPGIPPGAFAVGAAPAAAVARGCLTGAATRGSGMGELPSGTVTFLFTDLEGSTRL